MYLCILARNFNLIELSILEFDQIVAEKIKRLHTGSRFQVVLVSVSPSLQALNVFILIRLAPEEIFFIVLLLADVKIRKAQE